MKIDPEQPVGQIAIELADAVSIFEKYGIRFYPNVQRKLGEACLEAKVPWEKVAEELNKSEDLPRLWFSQEPDWSKESMAAVIRFLIHVHHSKTRQLLDNIGTILIQLVKSGHDTRRMEVVRDIFIKVNGELRHHMLEEERLIFPYLVYAESGMEKGRNLGEEIPKEKSFTDSIRHILFEHRFMDKGFVEIQKLVFLFRDDSGTKEMDPLAGALSELKEDNEKHIQLENNILLKRAAQLGLMD